MRSLLNEIRSCTICSKDLLLGPRPIVSLHQESKILVIGQAPGLAVHHSGIPWDDKSGENLRSWMNIDTHIFYDPKQIAIVPMGFCYPGKGKSGDLPPRPECAPQWHSSILKQLTNLKLTMLIGGYAQKYYLNKEAKSNLTETVRSFKEYLPKFFVLPHPSPRNNIWRAKNKWFDDEVLPRLKLEVKHSLYLNDYF